MIGVSSKQLYTPPPPSSLNGRRSAPVKGNSQENSDSPVLNTASKKPKSIYILDNVSQKAISEQCRKQREEDHKKNEKSSRNLKIVEIIGIGLTIAAGIWACQNRYISKQAKYILLAGLIAMDWFFPNQFGELNVNELISDKIKGVTSKKILKNNLKRLKQK